MKQLLGLLIAMPLIAWANPDAAAVKEAAPAPKPKPAPYTLPFHLRPISAGNVVRIDNVFAIYDTTGESAKVKGVAKGSKEVSILNAGYTFAKDWGLLARIGVANDFPKKTDKNLDAKNGSALTNGLLFFTYTPKFLNGDLRTAFYLGITAPIGSGGGNYPDKTPGNARDVMGNSGLVRSNMDGALFLMNDMAIIPGIDIAYVKHGLTVQLELTYLEIFRVRGEDMQKDDVAKRNFVGGLFVGYSIIPQLAVGVELRYQRWLKPSNALKALTESSVEADKEKGDTQMQNMTIALGLRGNFKIGEKTFFRPAISYAMGIMGEIADKKYHLIQLDLPFAL